MSGPRAEYERRMHRVQAYIDAHLAQPLDLATLAGVAHFSPFHFHRLFTAWMGETLGDYVRRRRLEVAAVQLATQPRLAVLQAALGVGFGSGEAFTRAFRAHFGASPMAWRAAQRNSDQADRKPGQAGAAAAADDGGTMNTPPLHVRQIELAPAPVAYLRRVGAYGAPLQRFWAEEVQRWLAVHGWTDRVTYGLAHDDPSITRPEACRYDAAAELQAGEPTGRDVLRTELPGGRYAVLHFDRPIGEIGAAWQRLLRDWLPASGLQIDARPCFERYAPGPAFDAVTGHLRCDLCLPVAPL